MSEIDNYFSPSALTCSDCGEIALFRKVGPEDGWQYECWLLEIPCIHCGSNRFRTTLDTSKWYTTYGTNE